MFCPNCGTQNSEAAAACTKCGFNIKSAAAPKFKGTMLMNQGGMPGAPGAPPAPPAPGHNPFAGTVVGVAPAGLGPSAGPPPAPPAPGGYGAPPQQGGYGAPPQQGGYGAPPQQPAFGGAAAAPQAYAPSAPAQGVNPLGGTMAIDQMPDLAAGGFPPPQQGYGAPPQQQGFGGPPPQQQGFGGPPPQGDFAMPANLAGAGAAMGLGGAPNADGRPTTRNPLMTLLIPFGIIIGGSILGAILGSIVSFLALVGTLAYLAGVGLLMFSLYKMLTELKAVTKTPEPSLWMMLFIPYYGSLILVPAEVTRAKQMTNCQVPTRSIIWYLFLFPMALASDLNDIAAAMGGGAPGALPPGHAGGFGGPPGGPPPGGFGGPPQFGR